MLTQFCAITGPGNDLSPVRHQAIISANADLVSIWSFRTTLNEIWI